ncbi:MAG: hypothetical protein PHQ32_05645 [Firmicutes bacterium]|nr:hypothetical protein [Bacillota bacterium]
MEENKNTIVQEKPQKNSNAALILGIIGTSTGVLALLIILVGLFFGGARYNMMDEFRNDRSGIIEARGNNAYDSDFCGGFRR